MSSNAQHREAVTYPLPDSTSPDPAVPLQHFYRLFARLRRAELLRSAALLSPILALAAAYATAHFWICDDAFISFRYARNLVDGHGLVFNLGERVEGYTNFLWVMELAGAWKLLNLRPELTSVALSSFISLIALGLSALLARTTPFPKRASAAVAATLLLLAVNRNFAIWTTSGLETRQFTMLVLLAIWLQDRAQKNGGSLVFASLAWATAALTRPDGQLLFACAVAWLIARSAWHGHWSRTSFASLLLPALLIIGAHELFRLSYYGDWLPNTYYAKNVGPWPEAGVNYLLTAVVENGLYLVVPLALIGLFARCVLCRDELHVFCFAVMALHAAYWAWIGGDHFEFRPMDFYWPLLAVATVDGLLALMKAVASYLRSRQVPHEDALSWFLGAMGMATVLLYSTVLQLGHTLLTYELRDGNQTRQLRAEITLADFPLAFALPILRDLIPAYNAALSMTAPHLVGARWQEHVNFAKERLEGFAPYEPYANDVIAPDMVAAMPTIGIVPYYLPSLTVIDTRGLTDRTVGRAPVTVRNERRQLAHDRRPPEGYLQRRNVNVTIESAAKNLADAFDVAPSAIYLKQDLWMPISSPNPAWLRQRVGRRLSVLDPVLERNQLTLGGAALTAFRRLGFFDQGGLDAWEAVGDAMQGQPSRGADAPSRGLRGAIGAGFIDTFRANGDGAQGRLLSPAFVPNAGQWLAFLLGGGSAANVGVELRVDDKAVQLWHGRDTEQLRLVTLALAAYAGKTCRLLIFDDSKAAWGHVLADHFMLLTPAAPAPVSTRP